MRNILTRMQSAVTRQHDEQQLQAWQAHQQDREAHEQRIVQMYDAAARNDFTPTETTSFMNMGYWKVGVRTFDEACQAMAELVAEAGQFSPGDSILDVGFGYGDQDMFWVERFSPQRIVGLNISPSQVEKARKRVADHGFSPRIDLRVGSATAIPFGPETFDRVAALEAAHHFLTREDFFRESFRVLRPGGRIVTADVIPLPGRSVRSIALNPLNMYPGDVYARKLEEAGFTNAKVSSIRDLVFKPYSDYIKRRLNFTNLRGRINVAFQRAQSSHLDYVIATADKPLV